MKKLTSLLLVLALAFSSLGFCAFAKNEAEIASDYQIKNIIFLIPDGGGPTLMDLANAVKMAGGLNAKYPNSTPMDTSPMTSLSYLAGFETTNNYSNATTDSAAGGTALSTGKKTKNGYVGLDHTKKPIANILEGAMSVGKAAGLVSTSEWPHATPASYSAHALDRNDYLNLYEQIESKGLQVVLGAGYGKVAEYGATLDNATNNGYTVVRTKDEVAAVKAGDKIWGNVNSSSLTTDIGRNATQPGLSDLTAAAIRALSADPDGFFLMVESSWVDSGGHNNNAVTSTSEYLSFDACWKVAVDFAKGRTDTIVVGAPDHDTGGLNLPEDYSAEVQEIMQGVNPSTFVWESTNHTSRNCPVWIYAPEGVEILEGLNPVPGDSEATRNDYIIDNTAFAPYLASLIGVDLDELSEELFVDVTTIGTYMPATRRFVFNNGDKYVYANKSVYYKDGEAIATPGRVAFSIENKFYVPADMVDEEDWSFVNTEDPDIIEGSGTSSDPYVIDSEKDFMEFIGGVVAGTTYSGKYFKQAVDLDFAGDEDFVGLTNNYTFAGNYNGNGHTINVDYVTANASSVFPAVSGTLINLGITGEISSSAGAAVGGIAQSVLAGGKIINCYSTVDFEGTAFCGIAATNAGVIVNAYYGGTADAAEGYAIADASADTFTRCYYTDSCGLSQVSLGVVEVTEADAKAALAYMLEGARAKVDADYGVATFAWNTVTGVLPVFESSEPIVTKVRLYPETQTVGRGGKFQFTANVDGKNDYDRAIVWSIEPQSSFEGTYIDKRGILHIDANETATSFNVMAKSKANGGVADMSVVTVADETPFPTGDGSKENPFLITCEKDFFDFCQQMKSGETFTDKYIKQVCDIDMAGYPDYKGVTQSQKFYGTYDGAGHIINVCIENTEQGSVFPYTFGTIMNLGTTGKVHNTKNAAGIARSLRDTSLLINCWSTVDSKATNASGIAVTGYGTIYNCYFAGTFEKDSSNGGYGSNFTSATNVDHRNCYYIGTTDGTSTTLTSMTEQTMKSTLYATLNAYRETAAEAAGLDADDLVYWLPVKDSFPKQTILYADTSSASSGLTIVPDGISIPKNEARQFAVAPSAASTDVIWEITTAGIDAGTVIDEYGYLTIGAGETNSTITIKATLKSDETIYDTVSVAVTKARVPDGTKDNPYIIANERDFLKFTNNIISGELYKDKYFLQTADLDMAGYPGYEGVGNNGKFYGTYNGGGHTINVTLAAGDRCIFPYTVGVIMNLGSTGYVKNSHSAGGICRSLRAADGDYGPGRILNCWSSCDVSGNYRGGIVPTNSGSVENCAVFGTVTHDPAGDGTGGIIAASGVHYSYFTSEAYKDKSNSSSIYISEADAKATLHEKLNEGIETLESNYPQYEGMFLSWKKVNGAFPVLMTAEGDDEPTKYAVSVSYALSRNADDSYTYTEGVVDTRAVITVLDSEGEAVLTRYESECAISENDRGNAVIELELELSDGNYTVTLQKNGYVTATSDLTVNGANAELSEITLIGGDIKSSFADICGDGIVDIDDFIRVLRGFSPDASAALSVAVDINEDGVVNVSDINMVKANFGR